jgi:hypothetical protein
LRREAQPYKGTVSIAGAILTRAVGLERSLLDERIRQVYFGIHHVANITLNEKTISIIKHGKNA